MHSIGTQNPCRPQGNDPFFMGPHFRGRVLTAGIKPPQDFYVSQIHDPEKLRAWLTHPASKDHKLPAANWCAMTCVRSILLAHGDDRPVPGPVPSLRRLFKKSLSYGVYQQNPDGTFSGAHHARLAGFIESEFELPASALRHQTPRHVMDLLDEGHFVIASVHPSIRHQDAPPPERRSGHLILIYGYTLNRDGFFFLYNDSTGIAEELSQYGAVCEFERFREFSLGNVIAVKSLLPRKQHAWDE